LTIGQNVKWAGYGSWGDTITTLGKRDDLRMNPAMWLVAALPFTVLGFSSFVLISRMIELVNQKLPKDQQIEYAYRYPGKMRKIRALYREHYPTGHLAKWELVVEVTGFVWLFVLAVILLPSN
jgi:hypothetical protein